MRTFYTNRPPGAIKAVASFKQQLKIYENSAMYEITFCQAECTRSRGTRVGTIAHAQAPAELLNSIALDCFTRELPHFMLRIYYSNYIAGGLCCENWVV